jgi:hypothetical protein
MAEDGGAVVSTDDGVRGMVIAARAGRYCLRIDALNIAIRKRFVATAPKKSAVCECLRMAGLLLRIGHKDRL